MNAISNIKILLFKELKDQFTSPLIYSLTGLFCLLIGWLFFNYMVLSKDYYNETLTTSVIIPIFANMNFIFVLIAPLITMRSFAEEKKQNTIELLFLSHLGPWQIIIGKFLAAWIVAIFMIAFTGLFPLVLALSGYSDFGVLFSSYAGLICTVACFVAVGIFTSSLTNNQIFAALLAFFLIFILMLLVLIMNVSYNYLLAQILQYLSSSFHFQDFVKGVIKSYNLIYFISFIFFFFYLTHESLDSRN